MVFGPTPEFGLLITDPLAVPDEFHPIQLEPSPI
jgi:hypothetical protein